MSNSSDSPVGTGCSRRAWGIGLLCVGLLGMVLGGANLLALLLSPTALQNDASFGSYFLSFYSVHISSLLVLIGLVLLKVHWLLAIGAFLLALLAEYVYAQGWLFPATPTAPLAYGFLVYGSVIIVLSLILGVSVAVGKGKSSKMPEKHS